MNSASLHQGPMVLCVLLLGLALFGCNGEQTLEPARPQPSTGPKRTLLGKNVFFEKLAGDRRRVVVSAYVCLREGQLEGFLTRRGSKEHEYILAADVDALNIHQALLAAKAEYGHPVIFGTGDKYTPATGSRIKVSVQYRKDGKKDGQLITHPAQQWIRDARSRKTLEFDWVFGGSRFVENPDDPKRKYYEANVGDIICVCNMPTAMLDLPIASPKAMEMRTFEANTELIPPLGTRVDVILEAVPGSNKEPQKDKGLESDQKKAD